MPLYSRVTFSLQPYAEALAIGDFQNKIMEEIMQFPDISQKWDSQEVEEKIIQLLICRNNRIPNLNLMLDLGFLFYSIWK